MSCATNLCSPLVPYVAAYARSDTKAFPTGNDSVPGFAVVLFQPNSAVKSSLVSGRSLWQLLGISQKKKAHYPTLSYKHKVTRQEKEGF